MKRFLVISSLILGATLTPVKALAAAFSQIVVYGDSLSDLGRASAATGGIRPGYTQGSGKFSNGRLWIEYLADRLGIPTNPNTNFAVGGAQTTNDSPFNTIFPGLIGIQTQIDNNVISDPGALYVIWGGANNYFDGETNPTIPVGDLDREIGILIGRGARNILIPNLPGLGNLPSTRTTLAAGALNTLSQTHNTLLANAINSRTQTNPGVNLTLLDVNSLIAQASSLGFTNTTDSCYVSSTSICSDPSSYLYWDDVHPTTAAHRRVGDLAFDALAATAIPEPSNLIGVVLAGGSVMAIRRKLRSKVPAKV